MRHAMSPGERAEADRAARQVAAQPRPQQHPCPLVSHLDPSAVVHGANLPDATPPANWMMSNA